MEQTAKMKFYVDALPEQEALVLTRLYWEKVSISAVARELGVGFKKVKGIERRAFARIALMVEDGL